MRRGSPPSRFMALRMAARSTTAGTPVKSCKTTRAGLNGISTGAGDAAFQPARFLTSRSVISYPSQFRRAASSSTRTENGSAATVVNPASSSRARR